MYVSDGAADQQLLMQGLLKVQKQMALPLQPAYFSFSINNSC
jgi:hypothetical protein